MALHPDEYERIRQDIEREYRLRYMRRNVLTWHMVIWFLVNSALWAVWLLVTGGGGSSTPTFTWVTVIWLVIMLIHIGSVGLNEVTDWWMRRNDQSTHKAKRDSQASASSIRLSDDGELSAYDYLDEDEAIAARR